MADLINIKGVLVSREKETAEYAPIRISFREPITDESMRSLAIYAHAIEQGEAETKRHLGIPTKVVADG